MEKPIIAIKVILIVSGTLLKPKEMQEKSSGASKNQQYWNILTGLIASLMTCLVRPRWETRLNMSKNRMPDDRRGIDTG